MIAVRPTAAVLWGAIKAGFRRLLQKGLGLRPSKISDLLGDIVTEWVYALARDTSCFEQDHGS